MIDVARSTGHTACMRCCGLENPLYMGELDGADFQSAEM